MIAASGVRGQRTGLIHGLLYLRLPLVETAGFVILGLACLSALFAPWMTSHSPEVGRLSDKLIQPLWLGGNSFDHPLGTDLLGRDIWSRVVFGARVSLSVGFLAVFVAGAAGTAIGVISGYFGGWLDALLMRLTDIALSMPLILMAIVLVALLGAGYGNIVLVVVLLLWPYYSRQVRGEVLGIAKAEYVDLARIAGCSSARIIVKHIVPNVMPTILVLATQQLGLVVLLEASLSFLGVGIPAPTPAWGLMVADGRDVIATAWWVAAWPGVAIFLVVYASNIVGDWLRDRLDPRLRRGVAKGVAP